MKWKYTVMFLRLLNLGLYFNIEIAVIDLFFFFKWETLDTNYEKFLKRTLKKQNNNFLN